MDLLLPHMALRCGDIHLLERSSTSGLSHMEMLGADYRGQVIQQIIFGRAGAHSLS